MFSPDKRTEVQCWLAIASFGTGCLIACICLFFIDPKGEISNSAISIVSEFLVLAGALLGIKSSFDLKMQRFEAEVRRKAQELENEVKNK